MLSIWKVAGFILLDEEKAFDEMSHTFMIMVLRKFGFGERFINWIRILYTDIHSAVKKFKEKLPELDSFIDEMICIPVGWWVTPDDREYIVKTIKEGW